MTTRRKFIGSSVAGLAAVSLLPAVNAIAGVKGYRNPAGAKFKMRFAIASDAHYGQAGTDFATNFENIIKWLNAENEHNHLDFVIINGDLVHNRPDLLPEVKTKYLDKLAVPYHTIPSNHDYADAAVWKNVFGYEDKYMVEYGDIAFVFAHTATVKGDYCCPNNVFLKSAFDKLTDKKMVFVILHIPPIQWMPSEKLVFTDCPDTVKLLHSYPNIKAVFHGHDHTLDGVRYTGRLPHFFDSHIGGDWGTDYRGYRVVEIDSDNIVYTYQVNASQNPKLNSNKLL
jgi:3',5'-cyclic AMP phosphodiesterase CpdA